jgi:hypothetical protein
MVKPPCLSQVCVPLQASDPWSADANSPAPHFVSPLHRSLLGGLDEQSTTPFAALISLLDLLGRAHTLHASKFDATDARALENVKDRTRQLVAALKRTYGAMPLAFTSDDMPYGAPLDPLIIAIVSSRPAYSVLLDEQE